MLNENDITLAHDTAAALLELSSMPAPRRLERLQALLPDVLLLADRSGQADLYSADGIARVIDMPSREWRSAIEIATLALDISDDGIGRSGFMFVLTGVDGYTGGKKVLPSIDIDPELAARAAMLIGGSGQGLYVDKIFGDAGLTKQFAAKRVTERAGRKSDSAVTLKSRSANLENTEKAIAMVQSGAFVGTPATDDAFAEALLITKLSDRSRGALRGAVRGAVDLDVAAAGRN